METAEVVVDTRDRRIVDLTGKVVSFSAGRGDGLCHVFVPHATAGLALIETGSGTEEDLLVAWDRLLPHDDHYRHRHGSPGHGADHVLPAFVTPSLVLAVHAGELLVGVWQSVVLLDTNDDKIERRVVLSFVGEQRS